MADCCNNIPQACIPLQPTPTPPALTSDCFVVNSLVCSTNVQKVAELILPAVTINPIITIDPTGTITPLVTLTPDINGAVSNTLLIRDKVINTGFIPANITIAGIELPVQVNLPFQQETECPGACPQDTLTETPFQVEAVIVQGIAALGITVAAIRFKVVFRTTITVTRPVIAKLPGVKPVQDLNPDRCETNGTPGLPTNGNAGSLNTSTILGASQPPAIQNQPNQSGTVSLQQNPGQNQSPDGSDG
ncbi:hypothetical protein [Salinithrix halophila]|uniref:SipL SPOCS domain-containing protein n=1 Tax=Salinithrix halophila TaxID=1485204 RepID=A0ABV8JCI5_9BACL